MARVRVVAMEMAPSALQISMAAMPTDEDAAVMRTKSPCGQLAEVDQGAPGGEVLHPDAGAFLKREPGRVGGERVGGDDGDLAVDAVLVGHEGGYGGADLADEGRVDARANRLDSAAGLVAEPAGEFGRDEVLALAEGDLGAVEADGFHAQADFAFGGVRAWGGLLP